MKLFKQVIGWIILLSAFPSACGLSTLPDNGFLVGFITGVILEILIVIFYKIVVFALNLIGIE